jgi:hypothetical protein
MRPIILFNVSLCLFLTIAAAVRAENIDPYEDGSQFAWSENVGWNNFEPSQGSGVTVRGGKVTGYIWQENVGWINLSPANYDGVTYDIGRHLNGYAWGENVGWINFNPTYGGVSIDSSGIFSGWAWGENIGWIHFSSTSPVAYKVQACVVSMDDLAHFADQWLASGSGNIADLYPDEKVDFKDFGKLAADWCDFCGDNWQLK